jgi:hypothetical protein
VKRGVAATTTGAAAGWSPPTTSPPTWTGGSGVTGVSHVCAAARVTGNHERSRPSTVCEVANVLIGPKASFGLAMRPASAGGSVSCCERNHALGLV